MKRAWKNLAVATFCALASATGCDSDDKTPLACPNYFGPPACNTDQECIDWHDSGNWYCNVVETVGPNGCQTTISTCVQSVETETLIEDDADIPVDDDTRDE